MNDYTKIAQKTSLNAVVKIRKDQKVYLSSLRRKERIERLYDQIKETPEEICAPKDFKRAFGAKEFWEKAKECGSWLEFRYYESHDKTKLHHANFCKRDKLCPACAVRRAYKQQKKFISIMKSDKQLMQNDWFYIVLPVKHDASEPFEVVFARVRSMLSKITEQMRDGRKGKTSGVWSRFSGGMYSIETTRSTNGWNVHLNLLVNAPKGVRLDLHEVRNRRGQISKQNEEIRRFLMRHYDSQMHHVSKVEFNDLESMKKDLLEVLKYSLKFSSLNDLEIIEFFVKTYRKRLYGTFGNLWGKGLEDVDLDGEEVLEPEFVEVVLTRYFENGEYGYNLLHIKKKRDEKAARRLSALEALKMSSRRVVHERPTIYVDRTCMWTHGPSIALVSRPVMSLANASPLSPPIS